MNNKGFTLVELLAVILILIGIAGVSVFGITSSLEKNDKRECERQKEIIENAAKVYFSLNTGDNEVNVSELVSEGYFDEDDVNKNSGASVVKNNGYVIVYGCSE